MSRSDAPRPIQITLLFGLCGAMAPAQSPDATAALREPGFGRVTTLDGTPWVGAVVHLLHRPHPGVLDESVADRITTTTDGRGRFRADLLPVSHYLVWAHEPLGADADANPDRDRDRDRARDRKTTRVTTFVTDGRARTPIFLTETTPVTRRRFRLATDASWDGTQFRVFAWSGGPERPAWQIADTRWLEAVDGVFELPPWPDDRVPIAVYGHGWQLWSHQLATRDLQQDAAEVATVQLPPLRRRPMVVAEAPGGGPLADVEIVDARGVPGSLPLRSDAWGGFEVVKASTREDFPLLLSHAHLRSPDHLERALSDRTLARSVAAGTARIELERAPPLQGQLRLGGVPLADSLLLLEARDGLPGKALVVGAPRPVRTDAAGRFRLPIPDRTFPLRVLWIPSPAERARLAEAWRAHHADDQAPPPAAPLVVLRDAVEPVTADETLELDLLDLQHLDLTLLGPDDLPAAEGAELLLFPPLTNPQAWRFPLGLSTDRRGRLRILRRGAFDDLQMIAVAGPQALATRLSPAANRDDLVLHFDPRQVVTVRLLDDEGRPWPDAALLAANPKGGDGLKAPCGTVLWFHAARIRELLQHGAHSAADGTLRLLCNELPQSIDLQLRSADGTMQGSALVTIPADVEGALRLEAAVVPRRR